MRKIRDSRIFFNVMALCSILIFSSAVFSSSLHTDRIIPKGKVTLYQGDRKVGEVTSEAPFPENTLLSVQGECGVKMKNLYLVATDQSIFSVSPVTDVRQLMVKQGTIYFALPASSDKLVFQTPDSVVTAHEILLEASSTVGLLTGYIAVADDATKIGVFEGGSMVVSVNNEDAVRIKAGQELILAQAEIPATGAAAAGGTAATTGTLAGISATTLVIGAGTLAAAGLVVSEATESEPASPSSP